jgi:polysaccharide biosynthesis transport protein
MKDRVYADRVAGGALRRWWMILLLALLVAGAGFFAASNLKPVYRAPGSILVGRPFDAANPDKEYIESSQQLAQAYADVATRQPVLEGVVDDLGLAVTWMELRDQVSIEVPADNPQLIEVAVEAGSPETAEQVSNQLLDRILQMSQVESQLEDREIQKFVTSRLETLEQDIRERQRRIDELEESLSVADPLEVANLRAQVDANQELVVRWQTNYSALLSFRGEGASPNDLQVLESGRTQATPVRPDVPLYTALAGGAGLFLGLALAYALEFRRERRLSRESVRAARTTGAEPSGAVPQPEVSSTGQVSDEAYDSKAIGPRAGSYDAPHTAVPPHPGERGAITLDDPTESDDSRIRTAGHAGPRPQDL